MGNLQTVLSAWLQPVCSHPSLGQESLVEWLEAVEEWLEMALATSAHHRFNSVLGVIRFLQALLGISQNQEDIRLGVWSDSLVIISLAGCTFIHAAQQYISM